MNYTFHLSTFQSIFSLLATFNTAIGVFVEPRKIFIRELDRPFNSLEKEAQNLLNAFEAEKDTGKYEVETFQRLKQNVFGVRSSVSFLKFELEGLTTAGVDDLPTYLSFIGCGLFSAGMLALATVIPNVSHLSAVSYDVLEALVLLAAIGSTAPIVVLSYDLFHAVRRTRCSLLIRAAQAREQLELVKAETWIALNGLIQPLYTMHGLTKLPLYLSKFQRTPQYAAVTSSSADERVSLAIERRDRLNDLKRRLVRFALIRVIPAASGFGFLFSCIYILAQRLSRLHAW